MKVFVIKRGFITLSELGKRFYLFSNNIKYCKFLRKVEWDLKRISNLIQKNQFWEHTWFDMINILHVIISQSEHYWKVKSKTCDFANI